MKKIAKQMLTGLLAIAMVLPMGTPAIPKVYAQDNTQVEYEIYPNPHDMSYQEGEYVIRPEVNVVFEKEIDDATKNRMNEVLKAKDKNITVTAEKAEGKTNILVGTYNSNGYVYNYVEENYSVDASLFEHYGSYFLASNNDEIVILGVDTDAAFYGITSLKHIFNQMDGSTIRNFEMRDYADVNIRGFIEGYYGIPWSNEDRMSLMRFGGDFKMTSYIFAPKDDPYHSAKWREPYPADKLEEIKEMTEVGNASKCRFVWTIHPFMNGGITEATYDADIQKIKDKFNQLYNVGVRQFGVLGDDAGNLPRKVVIRVMNDLQKWADEKGDVYDLVFCPQGYNHSWQGNYSELNELDEGFPEDVRIFWTGEAVCQPIEQKTLDHFRRYNLPEGKTGRRAPLFWLNWPVNDINHGRMLMGKGVQLHTDINVNDIYGAVTNPMQESEASKVAIFAVADYAWNVKGFEVDKSWEDSFKYIEADATEELHTLAKHMSNPQPNGHGLVLPESEELQPLLNEFKTKLDNNESVKEVGVRLMQEMDVIIDACDGFHAKSKNEALKAELLPFTNSLKELCKSIRSFVEAQIAIENDDMYAAFNSYTAGSSSFKTSKTFTKPMINGNPQVVSPGSTHLIPLAEKLEKKLSGPINDYVSGEGENPLVITAESSFTTWQEGNVNNIIDGDEKTHAWHNGYEEVGQYYQVNFSKPGTIYGVHILNGANKEGKAQDTFGKAKVKYKVSGEGTWKDLTDKEYGPYAERVDVSGIEIENVVAVRYECTQKGSGNKWPSMREFQVSTAPETHVEFTKEVIRTQEGWKVSQGKEENLIDEDKQTFVWYNVRQGGNPGDTTIKGDYVGVKLSQPITLGKIDILQGKDDSTGDYFKNVKLQYSKNGTDWMDIPGVEPFRETKHIQVDLSDKNIEAQYVRLENQAEQKNWISFREFDVDAKVFYNAKAYTNVDAYKDVEANVLEDSAELASQKDIALEKNQYIGLKLDRVHEITTIEKQLEKADGITLEVSKNGYEWTEYAAGKNVDARYVRLINKTDAKKTFDIQKLSLKTFEIYEKSLVADQTTFAIGEEASNPATNLFDGDRTTQVIYQGSQNQGAKFVYDLGQTIDLKTLKVVCRDSEIDFPRHAKISVSTDGQKWTDVMTIGNQDKENEGEASNEDNINDVLPLHETSYNAKLEENINKKARFIKFEITRTKVGSDKWVRFQEFEINGGEYMPTVNDPTFESDCLDTRNGKYAYMVDADLSTAFVPTKETGTLSYTVSDNNNVNVIKIIQGADAISNATVKARTLKNPDKWITLGTLAQTVNEFVLEKGAVLLDVKLEWKNVTPSITELVFAKTDSVNVDKAELKKLLDNKEDTSSWTTDSKQAYDAAIAAGQKVYDSEHASKGSVDSAVLAIKNAVADKELKGDRSKLQAALDKALKDSENYTARTWRVYSNAVSAIEAAKKNADNTSVAEVEKLLAGLEAAKSALVYNPSAMEECMLTVQAENDFINATDKSIYTEESWNNFIAAKEAVEQLIEKNKTTPVHPSEFKDALKVLKDAKEGLTFVPVAPVSKEVLAGLIKTAEGLDAQLYTKDSYQTLTEALNAAKAEFDRTDSTEESVKAAVAQLDAAIKALVTRANAEEVKAYINGIELKDASKYTEESYKVYKDAYQKLCGALDRLDNVSQEEYLKLRNTFETSQANLVEKDAAKPEQPKPDKPQQEQKPDPDDKHKVHTGDTTESSLPMAWLLASVVAVGGILISKKKRVK